MFSRLIFLSGILCIPTILLGQSLSLLAWNVESDGSDPVIIAKQLSELGKHQIFALSEVAKSDFVRYRDALGPNFDSIQGTHNSNDCLQLLFDRRRLRLIGWTEMEEQGGVRFNRENRSLRCPLLVKFTDLQTDERLQVVVNHLARGNAKFRQQQAKGLREWGRNQNICTIAIGDFNFDFDFNRREGNKAYAEFVKDGVWKWIEPQTLIDTNWYDRDQDGNDDYPDSMLDFAFVAGPAKEMNWQSRVVVRNEDFPDNESTSDHRPIILKRL